MQLTKYLDYLETLASETGKRSLCEAAADAIMRADVGKSTTLNEYMVKVGSEFHRMVVTMGKDITEYAVNKSIKKNSDYVFDAYELNESPSAVAAKLYADALIVPPKKSFVAPVHYISSGEKKQFPDESEIPMVAESVTGTISDFVKKNAMGLLLGAALGAGVTAGAPGAIDMVADMGKKAHGAVEASRNDAYVLDQVARWNQTGERIGDKKGWKYVDYKDKPGVYGPHFKDVSLSDIETGVNPITKKPLKVGWWVSPDGNEVFSTVTGKYFKVAKDFNDPSFTRDDLGKETGVGGHYVLDDSDCYDWDLDAYYGKGNW